MYGNVQMSKKQMQPNPRSPCVPFGKESRNETEELQKNMEL